MRRLSCITRFEAGGDSRRQSVQAALDYIERQLATRPISRHEWNEVLFVLNVFASLDTSDGEESLFARVQGIARRLTSGCVAEARSMRDRAWDGASEDTRARLNGMLPFGTVRQPMPPSFRSACAALVPPAKLRRF